MKGDRERRQQPKDDIETRKKYFLMAHARACLYTDESDPGVGD